MKEQGWRSLTRIVNEMLSFSVYLIYKFIIFAYTVRITQLDLLYRIFAVIPFKDRRLRTKIV